MNTVICSHGFGVKADGRGMFTEIEESIPNVRFVMFDYNDFDDEGNTIVPSLDEQAKKLQQVIDSNPNGSILLCHSQGSIIAGLVDLKKISKVILLAPPVKMSMERIIDKMMNKEGGVINLQGVSKLPRSDGSMTHLPKAYIESLRNKDPLEFYLTVATIKPTTILRSLKDEVLGLTNVDEVKNAKIIDVNADHNYTGISRQELIQILKSEISS
jgi:hypothetical protein